ncbi:glycosyltransferase [Dinghuibacter silviterrae]|uniref:Alpha-1,3-rhamnosyltransferase n=1 Tax=Dinghuibacter silviterrae TaxID=1539049 RepID=A0A4R8DQ56_9BACT|nr:glycosyltransferase [Dinghuibacter silviterrae]TDX00039.1 alpha-1,3-rhamnosyltransferase [Dinghuibacter silviterrae]
MTPQPLVSVIVVAFDSARFIEATLESIRRQTYSPIELVIADDASMDDTVELANAWLQRHGDRFSTWTIVRAETNAGLSQNCNNGWRASTGDWIKLIAADDLLLDTCIADNVAFAQKTPDAKVVFSRMEKIDDKGSSMGEYFFPSHFFTMDAKRQLTHLLRRNYLGAPSAFIARRVLEETGGFDPSFPMMEDLPLWTKLLVSGIRLDGLNRKTVAYRIHNGSIQRKAGRALDGYLEANRRFDRQTRFPLARQRSYLLYLVMRFDDLLPWIQRRRVLTLVCYPFLWAWYHYSPFTLSKKTAAPCL